MGKDHHRKIANKDKTLQIEAIAKIETKENTETIITRIETKKEVSLKTSRTRHSNMLKRLKINSKMSNLKPQEQKIKLKIKQKT
jgi:multidrug efflux pump subunit AcrB